MPHTQTTSEADSQKPQRSVHGLHTLTNTYEGNNPKTYLTHVCTIYRTWLDTALNWRIGNQELAIFVPIFDSGTAKQLLKGQFPPHMIAEAVVESEAYHLRERQSRSCQLGLRY